MLIYTTAIFRVVGGWTLLREVETHNKPLTSERSSETASEV